MMMVIVIHDNINVFFLNIGIKATEEKQMFSEIEVIFIFTIGTLLKLMKNK